MCKIYWTNWTDNIETHINREQAGSSGYGAEVKGLIKKGKRKNSCTQTTIVIAGGGVAVMVHVEVEEGIWGINGDEK